MVGVGVGTRAVARAKVRHVTSRSFAQRDRASGWQKFRRVSCRARKGICHVKIWASESLTTPSYDHFKLAWSLRDLEKISASERSLTRASLSVKAGCGADLWVWVQCNRCVGSSHGLKRSCLAWLGA